MAASRCGWIMTSLVTSSLPFNRWSRIHTGSKLGHHCVSRWPSTSTVQDISRHRDDYRMGSIFPRFLDFQWIRSVFLLAGLYIVPMAELFSRNLAVLRELKRNLKDLLEVCRIWARGPFGPRPRWKGQGDQIRLRHMLETTGPIRKPFGARCGLTWSFSPKGRWILGWFSRLWYI